MKNDDEKKMYDNLGIKGVYFEEMYEKTDSDKADSEKKEIRQIRKIFSSKSKFLGSVFSMQLMYDKIVGDVRQRRTRINDKKNKKRIDRK